MQARLLRLSEVSGSDWDRWRALADRAAESNVALDPRFLRPEQTGEGADHLLVIAEEGDRWFGLVRVFPTEASPSLGLRAFGTLEPSALGPSHPLLDEDRAGDALTALVRAVRRLLRTGYLTLAGFPASGRLADARAVVERRRSLRILRVASHVAAWASSLPPLRSTPADVREFPAEIDPEYRSAGTRKRLRRDARRLAEAAGGPLVLRDASADPEAIERLVALQLSGWKGDQARGGYAVGLDATRERSFRERVEAFGASGDLIVLELWAGSSHLYSDTLLVSAGVATGYLDAYQEEFRRFSTGTLARTAVCAHMRRSPGLVGVNPAIYYYDSEAISVFPDRRELADLVIGIGILPALAVRLLPRAERSRFARRAIVALNRADRLCLRVADSVRARRSATSRAGGAADQADSSTIA